MELCINIKRKKAQKHNHGVPYKQITKTIDSNVFTELC
jgi:hypothetical protein